MDLGLQGKRAAVAASSSGLGFATARHLVSEGAQVAICGRDADRIAAAAAQLGPSAVAVVADVSTVAGAQSFVSEARTALGGPIDILVANGGGPPSSSFDNTDVEAFTKAFESNTLASIAMCQAVVPEMKDARWGRIVAITSVVAKQPVPYLILSNTARAGLTAFLKTTSISVAKHGITVNSVMPGSHATDRIKKLYGETPDPSVFPPVGVLGRPEDFGATVAFLCSQHARYITGQAIVVDGGGYAGLF